MYIPEIDNEIFEITECLKEYNELVLCSTAKLEKANLRIDFRVKAPDKTLRAVDVNAHGDTYRELREEDLNICRDIITSILSCFHFKCKKCYISGGVASYYLKPDWRYWYK